MVPYQRPFQNQSYLVICQSDNPFGLRTKSDLFYQATHCGSTFIMLITCQSLFKMEDEVVAFVATSIHPSILLVHKTHNEKCKKMTVEQDSQGTCSVR